MATKPCFDVIIHRVLSFCHGEKLLRENKKLDIDHYEKEKKHALAALNLARFTAKK